MWESVSSVQEGSICATEVVHADGRSRLKKISSTDMALFCWPEEEPNILHLPQADWGEQPRNPEQLLHWWDENTFQGTVRETRENVFIGMKWPLGEGERGHDRPMGDDRPMGMWTMLELSRGEPVIVTSGFFRDQQQAKPPFCSENTNSP